MGYPLPPYRRAAPPPAPAPLPAPVLDELERQFLDKPYIGGSFGEMFPMPAAPPQPGIVYLDNGLEIEDPPWKEQPVPSGPPPAETAVPVEALGLAALAEMRAAAGDVAEPRYKIGPPARDHTPTFGVPIPPWPEEERREEERRRAIERARQERAVAEELPAAHPPAKREAS